MITRLMSREVQLNSLKKSSRAFQPGPGRMAPAKKGGEKKKGRSAISEVLTREYTLNIHERAHGRDLHELLG